MGITVNLHVGDNDDFNIRDMFVPHTAQAPYTYVVIDAVGASMMLTRPAAEKLARDLSEHLKKSDAGIKAGAF